jgi:4-alpha-glucanotransferase
MHKLLNSKHYGVLLPLFSMSSKNDWGCGDFNSIVEWASFVKDIGLDIIQILPLNEMEPQSNCPYTAITAFAIDPIYISIADIDNLSPEVNKKINSREFKERIKEIKKKEFIDYAGIKRIKFEVLWEQYKYFYDKFLTSDTIEKKSFDDYKNRNNYWLKDYSVFRRLKDVYNWKSWTEWDEEFKNPRSQKIEEFIRTNSFEIDFFNYLQWEIEKQSISAKEKLNSLGILLLGDLPFMVNQESADVWSRQFDFSLDLESGAPPDAFSDEGQRWGIPAPNWQVQMQNNFEWWRLKLRKFEELYDIFRIDHMVGFFRTWVIPKDKTKKPDFDIPNPYQQEERGRLFLKTVTSSTKMLAIAEDLGVIPDYVRKVLKEVEVCGYKIMRWEKGKDGRYIDPSNYERLSLATTSTHDTEPMKTWWRIIDRIEKKSFLEMIYNRPIERLPKRYYDIKDDVSDKLLRANSALVILNISDIIGSDDRINTPGTTGNHNWSFKIKSDSKKFYEKYMSDFDFLKKRIKEISDEKSDISN